MQTTAVRYEIETAPAIDFIILIAIGLTNQSP